MEAIQATKMVLMVSPELKDNGDFTTQTYVDTAGYDHLRVVFLVGAIDTTVGSTAEGTAPKLEECDTSGGTYADISGSALANSIAATEDDTLFAIDVPLKGRKRYIQVNTLHSGDGTAGAAFAVLGILSRAEQAPNTATEAGLTEWIWNGAAIS